MTTEFQSYGLRYDAADRVVEHTFGRWYAGESSEYGYDNRSQLESVNDALIANWDDNGNDTTTSLTYNQLDVDDEGRALHYDNEGNLIARVGGNDFSVYHWDHRNRLIKVEEYSGNYVDYQPDSVPVSTVSYGYDAYNQLISRQVKTGADNEAPSFYVNEGGQVVAEFDASGDRVPNKTYQWGAGVDMLLAVKESSSGQVLWAASDYQGTVRDWMTITSNDLELVEHVSYDAFGEIVSIKDGNGNSVDFSGRDAFFAYTGRLYDPATGLQNNLNRWYAPRKS